MIKRVNIKNNSKKKNLQEEKFSFLVGKSFCDYKVIVRLLIKIVEQYLVLEW